MISVGGFSSRISDVFKKFESVSGLIFKLKKEQDTAVKHFLSNRGGGSEKKIQRSLQAHYLVASPLA